MGAAASSSPPPPQEAAAASSSPPPPLEATAASDRPSPAPEAAAPPAKDPQHSTSAAAGGAAADPAADAAETVVLDASVAPGEAGDGEEEPGECGFCLFMKGGGCKEEFVAWEKCVEEAEAATGGVDVVERCHDITAALRKCMDAHADYYEPILRAERAMAADLEAFQAQEAASDSAAPAAEEGQEKQATNAEAPLSEEGQKKQLADAVAPPSEEGKVKQPAEAVVSEKESRDPAA